MSSLSLVVTVVDSEIDLVPRLFDSLKNIVDEILVIDMTSGEELSDIIKDYKVNLIKHKPVAYVEIVRNFGIEKAKSDWILVMDPDEEMLGKLTNRINKIINETKYDYFRLPRKNIIFGKWMKYSRWWPDYNIRLFKKGFVSWNEIIHTIPFTKGEGGEFPAEEEYAIIHHHYDSIDQYIERMNRYSSVQAENKISGGYKFDWKDLIKKPCGEFLSRYFAGQGYKDGLHGLVLALLQAFSELVVYLKIWQKSGFDQKNLDLTEVTDVISGAQREVNYWKADALFHLGGGMIARIKRKLKLS